MDLIRRFRRVAENLLVAPALRGKRGGEDEAERPARLGERGRRRDLGQLPDRLHDDRPGEIIKGDDGEAGEEIGGAERVEREEIDDDLIEADRGAGRRDENQEMPRLAIGWPGPCRK